METKANHLLIGVVTLLGVTVLLVFGLWSASFRMDAAWQEFEVHFKQAVSGLTVGSVVQYNGINMGSVRELYLDPADPRQVVAAVRLQAEAPLCLDTTARLIVNTLTGVSFIQLRGGCVDSAPLIKEAGRRPVIVAEESALQRLIDQSEDIAGTASEVMLRLLDFLSEENASRVSDTLDNIDAMTLAIASEKEGFGDIVRNVRDATERANTLLDELAQSASAVTRLTNNLDAGVVERLPEISADLQMALAQFAGIAERVDQLLAENEQALAEFGQETLTQFGPAIQELRQLLRELSRSSSRFDRHPARFLLGGDQPQEYRPQ